MSPLPTRLAGAAIALKQLWVSNRISLYDLIWRTDLALILFIMRVDCSICLEGALGCGDVTPGAIASSWWRNLA